MNHSDDADQANTLWLYGTAGCHLCEQALQLVLATRVLAGWSLEVVDIAEDLEGHAQLAEHIPVLERADGARLFWPFDQQCITGWLGINDVPDFD